jgi:hypothetical protein
MRHFLRKPHEVVPFNVGGLPAGFVAKAEAHADERIGFFAAATIFGKIRLIGRVYWIILPVSHTTAD